MRPELIAALVLSLAGCSGDEKTTSVDGDAGSLDVSAPDVSLPDTGPGDLGGQPDAAQTSDASLDASADASPRDVGAPSCREGSTGVGDECLDLSYCADLEAAFEAVAAPPAVPSQGTVWFSADLLTDADPTSFRTLTPKGQGLRTMYDRRTAAFDMYDAHLFDATFGADKVVEIQVNPEFTAAEAEAEALEYAEVIGRLPGFLFADLETVWIHRGNEAFGGGNHNLLIHTERTPEYRRDGVLEEVFIHEGAHTSMDAIHALHPTWAAAQAADGVAISTYARDNPQREDVAETLGPYLALRHRRALIGEPLAEQVLTTVPNRVRYLDCLTLSLDPLE